MKPKTLKAATRISRIGANGKRRARSDAPYLVQDGSEPVAVGEAYLDKVAVAKRLGVKPKTVGEWANQGKLPAYRIGPYLRFKWAEVEARLAARCRVATGAKAES